MKRLRLIPAVLAIAAALFGFCARPASAAPALWVVQSAAGKVYLFGTVHVMRPDVQWHSRELDAAIAESQDLYLEIADVNDHAAGAVAIAKAGLDPKHTLSSEIPKSDVALLDAQARKFGYPGEFMFEHMRPWLAYMMLSVLPALHDGYQASTGVDMQIRKTFADANKPVRGFETFDMQAHVFSDMPQNVQVVMLHEELKQMSAAKNAGALDALVAAWASGDEEKIAASFGSAQDRTSPMYAALVTNRNKAWATALAARLKQPGTSFVAVGAAHLAGPGGVPALLQQMGYTVTRVQIGQTTPAPPTATPSVSPSVQPSASAAPVPSASATPVPVTIKAPAGWAARKMAMKSASLTTDMMWVKPGAGVVFTGHVDMPAGAPLDLDTFSAFFQQGLASGAGVKSVQKSQRVKICGGKQEGMYGKVTLVSGGTTLHEDIVFALSDRAYLAEYVRPASAKDDPAAIKSLLSLCAP